MIWPLAVLILALAPAAAQDKPFVTHESRAVITHGPYLLAPTENSVTVVWRTDSPAHAKLLYGRGETPDRVAEPHEHGLKPIRTLHAVHLTGLEPGVTYRYRIVTSQVVKMRSYWPEKGQDAESPLYSFTTFDRRKPSFVFYAITDTHADLDRIAALLKLIDLGEADFLVHLGDAFDTEDEEMIWTRWLDPLSTALAHSKPLLWVRGNHETRGASARALMNHVPIPERRYYYARDHGAAHFLLLDTGEDKPDATNVYSQLNAFAPYRDEELAWLRQHLAGSAALRQAPFRIMFMHAPNWGWTNDRGAQWDAAARQARVDLSISGHTHRFSYRDDAGWHRLVLAPTQAARVEVTPGAVQVRVIGPGGATAADFTIPRRPAP